MNIVVNGYEGWIDDLKDIIVVSITSDVNIEWRDVPHEIVEQGESILIPPRPESSVNTTEEFTAID